MTADADTSAAGVRAKQKQETRKRVLSAALLEFSQKGFDSASLRTISANAGVNHGLIKYHFHSKEELWKAAVDFLFRRLHEAVAEPEEDKSKTRSERLRLWIRRYVRYCSEHPEHARIMVQESIRDSERLRWAAEKHIGADHQVLLQSLPRDLDLSRFPNIDMKILIYVLNAAMQAPFTLAAEIRHIYAMDVYQDEFVETYADSLFDLFYRPYLANTDS